jgi:hypothetical protein
MKKLLLVLLALPLLYGCNQNDWLPVEVITQ